MQTKQSHHQPDIILAAWQTQLAQAQDKPWLAALLLRQGERLFRRFVYFYQQLRALPRKTRRVWQKKLATTLAGAALLLALAGPIVPSVHAATITVDGATCTLANAISAANLPAGGTVGGCTGSAGADTINLQTDVILSGALPQITSAITLEGNNHTIDGNNSVRVLHVDGSGSNAGDLTLNNATITGGSVSSRGGGIYNYYGTVTLNNSTVSGNSANRGGGIYNYGTITLSNSTVSGNSANRGGGIYNYDGTITLSNSTVSGNSASSNGGGIYNYYGTVTLNNSTVSGNSAGGGGGGIYNYFGTATVNLNRSLVSGNTATTSADEIYNYAGTVNADNYNLLGDSSKTNAQAFYGFTPGASDIDATSSSTYSTALANILDPALALNGGPAGGGGGPKTHSLVAGSPALDAIPSASCGGLTQDQRGLTRPVNTNCDIGAFELQSSETSNFANTFPATNIGGTNVGVTTVNSGSPGQVNVLKRAGIYPGGSQTSGEFPIIWVLTATGSPFNVNLRLCYTAGELTSSGVTDENTIIAYRWDETSGSWVAQTTTPDPANNCVSVDNVTGFSPWTLAGDGGAPTAVNLQDITTSGSGGGLAAAFGILSLALGSFWLRLRQKK